MAKPEKDTTGGGKGGGGGGTKGGGKGGKGGDEGGTSDAPLTLYAFGDSLLDQGNFLALTSEYANSFPLSDYGYSDAFTNGETYATRAATLLGVMEGDYQNYAIASARASGSYTAAEIAAQYVPVPLLDQNWQPLGIDYNPVTGAFDDVSYTLSDPNFDIALGAQTARAIADLGGTDPDNATALINIGALDVADSDFFDWLLGTTAYEVGLAIETASRDLLAAGFDRIVLASNFDASFWPIFADAGWIDQTFGGDLMDAVNEEIFWVAYDLVAEGYDVVYLDNEYLSAELAADMGTYGFLYAGNRWDTTGGDAYWVLQEDGTVEAQYPGNPDSLGFDDDQVMFWDLLHPSHSLHGVQAAFLAEHLTADVMLLGGGDNVVRTGSTDHFVMAGAGNDQIIFSGANDAGFGGTGNDTLEGRAGADLLVGGSGNDIVTGGAGSDVVAGSAGDDTLSGGSEADLLIDGNGSDTADGGDGDDVFYYIMESRVGGVGGSVDVFEGGADIDTLVIVYDADLWTPEVGWELDGSLALIDGAASFDFAGSTLDVTGFENVYFTTDKGLPADIVLEGDLVQLALEAESWGLL